MSTSAETPKPRGQYRKPATDEIDYQLKKIPRDLWDRVHAKCKAQSPPLTVRWAILALLERFVDAEAQPKRIESARKPAVIRRNAKAKAAKAQPPPTTKVHLNGVPDLGDCF